MKRVNEILGLRRLHERGITGRNVTVAVLDTGIAARHPDFFNSRGSGSRIIAFADMTTKEGRRRSEQEGQDAVMQWAYDDYGHGTHCSGILGGNGKVSGGLYCGVAPECNIVSVKVLNRKGEANVEEVLWGLDWVKRNQYRYHINVVNISVGSTKGRDFDENSPLVRGVDEVWDQGMVVLTAAGNHGPERFTIGAPGNSRKIITVGSSDDAVKKGQRMIMGEYSGRGPTTACIKKPDIVAPGSNIISCSPSGTYTGKSGTSMSTPIVSGCVALLLSCYPGMSNREVKIWMRENALDMGFPHEKQGWGMINMESL